jgi:sec-independent protein translocase protein TatC
MALLNRVVNRGPARPKSADAVPMTVIEHLEDLRRALIVSVAAWAVCSIVMGFFWSPVLHWLIERGGIVHGYYTALTGAFFLAMQIALALGFVLAFPVIAYQAWWFVSPGLHQHEKRLVLPLGIATVVFFAIGVGFALLSLPLFVRILTGFAPLDLTYLPIIDQYVSFVVLLIVAYGVVFELPVVIYVLGRLRIISSRWLYQHRAAWVIGLGVLANFMTPGADPITPLIMFIPLWVFWELSTLLLRITGR